MEIYVSYAVISWATCTFLRYLSFFRVVIILQHENSKCNFSNI